MHRSLKVALCAAAVGAAVLPNVPASAATFGAPVVVSTDDVTEPGVEVAPLPSNTLYVHGPTGIPLRSSIWRSTDDGASWAPTPPLTRTGLGGGDIDIAIQPNGKLGFTDLWLGSSSVGTSINEGSSWTTNQLQGVVPQDRQWLATTGRDVMYHVTHQLEGGHVVSKSLDGGLTYAQHVLAATALDQGNCLCPPGYIIAEAGAQPAGIDDKVGIVYTTSTGVKFSRSFNGGLTWTHSIVDPTGGGSTLKSFPIVQNAGGNKLVAAWVEVNGNNSKLWFSSSANWGQTWATPTALVTAGTSVFPWIAVTGTKVGISLYHTSSSGTPNTVPNSAQWHLKYLESTNLGATWGALTTADSTPAKSGQVCTEGLNCAEDRELGDFQMLAFDNAGKAVISYVRVNPLVANDSSVMFVKEA